MTQVVTNKSLLMKSNDETKHVVPVDPDDPTQVMEVWVRDISFLDIQDAAQKMVFIKDGDISLSLKAYWEHAFTHWIVRTNPEMTSKELLSLKYLEKKRKLRTHDNRNQDNFKADVQRKFAALNKRALC